MMTVKQLADVLAHYAKDYGDLPVKFDSNYLGGFWPEGKTKLLPSEHAVAVMTYLDDNLEVNPARSYLNLSLFLPDTDKRTLEAGDRITQNNVDLRVVRSFGANKIVVQVVPEDYYGKASQERHTTSLTSSPWQRRKP